MRMLPVVLFSALLACAQAGTGLPAGPTAGVHTPGLLQAAGSGRCAGSWLRHATGKEIPVETDPYTIWLKADVTRPGPALQEPEWSVDPGFPKDPNGASIFPWDGFPPGHPKYRHGVAYVRGQGTPEKPRWYVARARYGRSCAELKIRIPIEGPGR